MWPRKLKKKKFLKFWDCFSEKEVFGQNITKLGKKIEKTVLVLVSEEQYITLPLSMNPRWNKLHIYDQFGWPIWKASKSLGTPI